MAVAPAILYCSEADLASCLSVQGTTSTVDDDQTGTVTAPGEIEIQKAIGWGTDRVNFYLLSLYSADDLALSFLVNQWATICSCKWLSMRRGNPSPESMAELYKECIADMLLVKNGGFQIPGLGTRMASWPAWSNVSVSLWYSVRKIRVERTMSDIAPPLLPSGSVPRAIDWQAEFVAPAENV